MKKKVKIYGSEIKRAVRRGLMENISENWEMKDTYSKAKYKQSPREKELESAFGEFGGQIDASVLRYLRKNPKQFIKRLADIYGEKIYDYIGGFADEGDESIEYEEESVFEDAQIEVKTQEELEQAVKATDGQKGYTIKYGIDEEDKPSKGLSKKKKSAVAKKARRGGDIGKKGKNFDKIAKKAAKRYGSEEAGERVAAAAMWKNIKR